MVNLRWIKEKLIVFLLIFLIFLLPTFLKGGYTFYSLILIETLILLTALIWSFGKIMITKSFLNLPILSYMLSCLLSTINSEYLRGSWEEIVKLACCIIFFLMTRNYLCRRLRLVIHTFIFTTLILVSFSLIYFFSHFPKSLNERLFYPLGNPNILAGFLVITIPLVMRISWEQTLNMRFRFLSHLLLLFSFIILYFTHSRGGALGVIVAILFLFFITRANIKQSSRYIFLIPCLLIGMVAFKSILLSLWTEGERIRIWRYSWQMFLDHPILGVGLGAYPNVSFNYNEESLWHLHSHNIFIQHACEVGIIGLISFVWLLVALFNETFRRIENNYENAVREGLLASLIGCLIHNQVDYLLWLPGFQLYFWLILGILSSTKTKEYILSPNLCRVISIIIILFWSFCIIKPFLGYVFFNEGVELADKGKWEEAKVKFEKAVSLDFYHPIYHTHLGIIYTRIHPPDLAGAIKEYEKAKQLDNYNPQIYSNLKRLYYQKENLPLSQKSSSREIKLGKEKKKDTLCWKLYRRLPME